MNKTVMIVDSEDQILDSFQNALDKCDYKIVVKNNTDEAIEYLKNTEVSLIVADISMKSEDMNFLRYVKNEYPGILRVALSRYTNRKNVYKALESNLARIYLFKPWEKADLVEAMHNMFSLRELLANEALLKKVNSMDKLPTLPDVYTDISKAIEEKKDVDIIAAKLERDQSISTRILRIANSAFYGAKTGVISQAIMYIGLTNVKNIVLSNSVFDMESEASDELILQWQHASLSNKITNAIYQDCLQKRIPNIFATAGLLHDIGSVLHYHNFPKDYKALLLRVADEKIPVEELENDHLGVSHEVFGGLLLDWWELPVPFVEAAMYHHNPLDARVINKELVAVVHLASHYSCKELGLKTHMPKLDRRVFDVLEIDEIDVESLARNLARQKIIM